METKAPYTLIGIFAFAVIAAVFGFVYWLHNTGGLSERTVYRVKFEKTVSGLLTGAAVLFNGVRVGEVTALTLDAENPQIVLATIAVNTSTPVRADTIAGLDFQGLTGVPVITLEGGKTPIPDAAKRPGLPYTLVADPTAGESMTKLAREALHRLNGILADNAEPIRTTINNLNTFSGALARNSDKLDTIVAGLERLTGGANIVQVVYELNAPKQFPEVNKKVRGRLTITEPTAVAMFETRKILVRPKASEDPSFTKAGWSDTTPRIIQAKLIEAFENAGLGQDVSRSTEGIDSELRLLLDIRKFQISNEGAPAAEIELSAKIVTDGRVTEVQVFQASVPVAEISASRAAAALSQAFEKCATDIVTWTTNAR